MARQMHRYQHVSVPNIRVRRGGAGGGWPAKTRASQLLDALHVNVVDVLALGVLAEFPDRQCVELQGAVGQGRCWSTNPARSNPPSTAMFLLGVQPYPAWREMFNNILPAHIVKDVPGGFAVGLARTMPVTAAGEFRMESIDPQRDEILLAHNDRFLECVWQAGPGVVPTWRCAGGVGRLEPQRKYIQAPKFTAAQPLWLI